MAITPTNSNTINISNLPQAQLAVDTDLIILQTSNGTQTIPFKNFNVVRTDVNGNASVIGTLSGSVATLTNVTCTSLTASDINTAYGPGVSQAFGPANFLTIQNGVILSAASIVAIDPVYQQLYNVDVPTLITQYTSAFKGQADVQGKTTITVGTSTVGQVFGGFFQKYPYISIGQITPANFNFAIDYSTLTPASTSFVPYVPVASIVQPINSFDLQFQVNIQYPTVEANGIPVYFKFNAVQN